MTARKFIAANVRDLLAGNGRLCTCGMFHASSGSFICRRGSSDHTPPNLQNQSDGLDFEVEPIEFKFRASLRAVLPTGIGTWY